MHTECESVVTEAELPGDKDGRDEGEGYGDRVNAVEEMGDS